MFSRLEGTLSAMLRLHLLSRMGGSVDDMENGKHWNEFFTAGAMVGSMRYQTAKDTVKRMMDIQNITQSIRENIDKVFNQAGDIQKFRDMLAHQSLIRYTDQEPHYWFLSDIATTRAPISTRIWRFHVDTIAYAYDDLGAIHLLFGKGPVVTNDIIPDPDRFSELPAWKYRPSLLTLVDLSTLSRNSGDSILNC